MRGSTSFITIAASAYLASGCGHAVPPKTPGPAHAFVGAGSIVASEAGSKKVVWACAPKPGIRVEKTPTSEKSDDAALATVQITEAMRAFIASKPEYEKTVKSFAITLSGGIEGAAAADVATNYDALSPRCHDALKAQKAAGATEFRIVTKLYHGMIRAKLDIVGPVQKADRQALLEKLEEEFSEQVWNAKMGDDLLKAGGGVWVLETVPLAVP